MQSIITINSRKFDGQIHRNWKCKFVEQKGNLLIFVGEFEKEVKHSHLGVIRRGTVSYEFYWLDGWFNVFRFHEPEGDLRNFYCNLNMPPKFENGVLDYVDLDIDILVWTDFRTEILDLEEFETNAKRFGYSEELKSRIHKTIAEILEMIARREFPFDFK